MRVGLAARLARQLACPRRQRGREGQDDLAGLDQLLSEKATKLVGRSLLPTAAATRRLADVSSFVIC
jgi:hypothetical protein